MPCVIICRVIAFSQTRGLLHKLKLLTMHLPLGRPCVKWTPGVQNSAIRFTHFITLNSSFCERKEKNYQSEMSKYMLCYGFDSFT